MLRNNHFLDATKMVNHIVDANDMAHKLINYEVLMNKLYEEIKAAVKRYDNNRLLASEILDIDGMEEAIIDELRARGFEVIDGDEI